MQLTISKIDLQYIRDLVKDASDNCKKYGFVGSDDLLSKLVKALSSKIKHKKA